MTKADKIQALAAQGMKPAEIAKELGIRYQHAYNVVNTRSGRAHGDRNPAAEIKAKAPAIEKPDLTVDLLMAGGFQRVSRWASSGDNLVLETPVPCEVGVYALVKSGMPYMWA